MVDLQHLVASIKSWTGRTIGITSSGTIRARGSSAAAFLSALTRTFFIVGVASLAIFAMFWTIFSYPVLLFLLAPTLLWVDNQIARRRLKQHGPKMQLLLREEVLEEEQAEVLELSRPPRSPELAREVGGASGPAPTAQAVAPLRSSHTAPVYASPLVAAEALASEHRLPLIDLLAPRNGAPRIVRLDRALFELMPVGFWRNNLIVPLVMREGALAVAMADPGNTRALQTLQRTTRLPVKAVVTGYRDILAALQHVYQEDLVEESRLGLLNRQPENSAAQTLTVGQRTWALALIVLTALGIVFWKLPTLIFINAVTQFYYLGLTIYKLQLMGRHHMSQQGLKFTAADLEQIDWSTLPIYTVLVPAYREARVLPILAKALAELNYPHDRLDVKLLLEADDAETIAAARALRLPSFIDIIIVPASEPRTKPKACNYGLQLARGKYVVIFDAEDVPEPDQLLKAVLAFREAGTGLACVQAKLAYFNRDQNLLTRWFTAEYLMWFDLLLPSLYAARLPIPLGGTSNHFRTEVLRQLGGWDPYNVAEDADLGIRLHKGGYLTTVIDSITYEEATSRTGNWIRQRSRWVKGYMQTWLVHMRNPVALWRSLGPAGFVGFQVIVGGTPAILLLNTVYAILTTLWYLTQSGMIEALLPAWVYYVAMGNLFLGNFVFTYLNMLAVARRTIWSLVFWTVLSPIYWTLMSVAAWKALIQLITRPSYWEKTVHGMTETPDLAALHEKEA